MTDRVVARAPSELIQRPSDGRRTDGVQVPTGVVGQSTLFTVASVLVSLVAMGCSALAARSLTTDEFGGFALTKALLLFLGLVFEFGVCSAAARRVAQAPTFERGRVLGATFLAMAPLAVGLSVVVFLLVPVADRTFHVQAATALALSAPFGFAYLFRQQVALQLSRAVGRLHVYSLTTLLGQALFFLLLAIAVAAGGAHGLPTVLTLQSVAFAAASVVAIVWLRPTFRRARAYVPALLADTRRWAFQLYVGRVLSIGTYNMDVLMLGVFANARSVGYYAIAGSIGSVAILPTTGFTSALFPKMVHERRIDPRRIALAYMIGAASVLAVWLLAEPFVTLVFSDRYREAATLAIPMTIASSLMGVTTVYSTFLSAQARGRELRDAGFVLTGSNIVLNIGLIPPFGATGAAWASVGAVLANLGAHMALYRRAMRASVAGSA